MTADNLVEGGRLYRRHCLQCHGLSGDGRGPTGQWIYPHPRDFRRGLFKFVSTGDGAKPRKADIALTVRNGLKGTAMPSFALLPEDQREKMVAYVVYLSLRGEIEFQTLAAILSEENDGPSSEGDVEGFARERALRTVAAWDRAETAPPLAQTGEAEPDESVKQTPEYLESVRRGYGIFTTKAAADCATCHEDFGRKASYRYDVWGTVIRPTDLTSGAFKGGNRAEDIYQRIRGGIQPSTMPSHPTLGDAQVWDLVRFVRALPYPRELPPEVRAKVYP